MDASAMGVQVPKKRRKNTNVSRRSDLDAFEAESADFAKTARQHEKGLGPLSVPTEISIGKRFQALGAHESTESCAASAASTPAPFQGMVVESYSDETAAEAEKRVLAQYDLKKSTPQAASAELPLEIKSCNPDLKKRYEKVGTKRDAQQSVRREWLQNRIGAKLKEHNEKNTTYEELDACIGKYKSLTKMWKDECGTKAAWCIAQNVAETNFRLYTDGHTVNGHPYIKYNTQKNIVQFLELSEEVGRKHTTAWSSIKQYGGKDGADEDDRRGKEGANRPLKRPAAALTTTPDAKQMGASIKKAMQLFSHATTTKINCGAIEHAIKTDPAWVRFNTETATQPLLAEKAKLEAALQDPLWKQMSKNSTKEFPAFAKKTWTSKEIDKMIKGSGLESATSNLAQEIEMLQ
ncbi:unnamed protein product, partial [Prorocentrum cordatum]